jgi:hypothetical protein
LSPAFLPFEEKSFEPLDFAFLRGVLSLSDPSLSEDEESDSEDDSSDDDESSVDESLSLSLSSSDDDAAAANIARFRFATTREGAFFAAREGAFFAAREGTFFVVTFLTTAPPFRCLMRFVFRAGVLIISFLCVTWVELNTCEDNKSSFTQ